MGHSGTWNGLLKLLQQRVVSRPSSAESVLAEVGLEDSPDPVSDADEFLCDTCGSWFDSVAGLRIHKAKLHGNSNEGFVKRFLAGSICPVCEVDFFTRARAVQHLRLREVRACTCRLALEAGSFEEVSPESRRLADAADLLHGRRCRANGINPLAARGRGCLVPLAVVSDPFTAGHL